MEAREVERNSTTRAVIERGAVVVSKDFDSEERGQRRKRDNARTRVEENVEHDEGEDAVNSVFPLDRPREVPLDVDLTPQVREFILDLRSPLFHRLLEVTLRDEERPGGSK